jgi:hypothetical protein
VKETPAAGVGYEWYPDSWSECDAPCGGGGKKRRIQCKQTDTLETVPGMHDYK